MRKIGDAMKAHLASGATTLARCWKLTRADGQVMGFTDHDRDLSFDGVVYRAGSGLDAGALQQGNGLAVDNGQAIGALSDAAVTAEDIRAGRYDRAEIELWLVNWRDVAERALWFRGLIGEIRQRDGVFEAEIRGLAELLNQPQGRAFHRKCAAVLGDASCKVDLSAPGYSAEVAVGSVDGGVFLFDGLSGFDAGWFAGGVVEVLDGAAAGLRGVIRLDGFRGGQRRVELWEALAVAPAPGDRLRLLAGCDKRGETCRLKFHNFPNFRGFPHIPGDDWQLTVPARAGVNNGGSLFR